jgi:uncharacterized membrane protein
MRSLKRKVAIAALAAGAVFGGLAVPGTAFASDRSVEIQICSGSTETVKFYLVGENQYGDWTSSQFWEIAPKGCTLVKDWWWKADRSVEFHHRKASTGWRWEQRYLPTPGKKQHVDQLYIG